MDNLSFSIMIPPFSDIFTKRLFYLHAEKNEIFFNFLNVQFQFLFDNQYDISADRIKITACLVYNNLVGSAFLYLPHPDMPHNIKNAFISNIFVLPQFRLRGITVKFIGICEEISLSSVCKCGVIPPVVKESFCKITPVDLATVQSICSVRHYKLSLSRNTEEISGCEIGEYFSEIIVTQHDQYLILKNIKIDPENQTLFMNVIHDINSIIKKNK